MDYSLIYLYAIPFSFMGACMASFICCASNRYKNHEDFMKSRSRCDSCGHVLSPLDLVPVFSWLFLKGKCRYCKSSIPVNSTLEEIGLAVMFGYAWVYLASDEFTPLAIVQFIFMLTLGCVAVIDAEIEEVPYTTQFIFGLCAVAAAILPDCSMSCFKFTTETVFSGILAVLVMAGAVLVSYIIQRYMGQGDVIIYFACTFVFSPWLTVMIVLVSSITALLIYLAEEQMHSSILVKCDSDTQKPGIRLVPAIAFAVMVVSCFQNEINCMIQI